MRQNIYVYSLYRKPDSDDRIFDCLPALLASMAAVQDKDVRASYLFVGDLNRHHQKWLGSATTNLLGVPALTTQQSLVAISTISICLMMNAGMLLASSRLTGKSLSAVKFEIMKPIRRLNV